MNSFWSAIVRPLGAARWLRLVIALVITALYCLSFSFFLTWLVPDYESNVNAAFVDNIWKILLLAALSVYLVYFLVFKIRKRERCSFENEIENLKFADLALVLLPLTPIVQYVMNNQDILSTTGSLTVVGVFAGFSVLVVLVIPALFALVSSAKILAIIGMAFAFTITNMPSLTAHSKWLERGDLKLQIALFLAIILVGLLLYRFVGPKFTRFVVALYFVANGVNSFVLLDKSGDEIIPATMENKMVDLVGERVPFTTPDIYFLIYDAYVASETMREYGIDNAAQEDYLRGMGFQLYPQTYSITAATVSTVSRILSVSRQYYREPRTAVSGDAVVQRLLQSFGYQTYGVFWSDYFFQGGESYYDHSFPDLNDPQWMLVKAIFMGEFRFDTEFDQPSREEFVAHKSKVFAQSGGKPKFVYVHDDLPGHSQNSGVCLPDEEERYAQRLAAANEEMKSNIDLIVRSNPGAIVIVAGDHGPYLTKNCYRTRDEYDISEISRCDVQDRYGTFLAIRWPDDTFSRYDDIVIIQDLFPVVFAVLFQDSEFESARIVPRTGSAAVTTSGVEVVNGIIRGGANDGEPLFVSH